MALSWTMVDGKYFWINDDDDDDDDDDDNDDDDGDDDYLENLIYHKMGIESIYPSLLIMAWCHGAMLHGALEIH